MIQTEAQLEQQFIEKLADLKYVYRKDIKDLEALENNFRQKFERLNFVNLSDAEFRKLIQENVTGDVFAASKRLRQKQTFVRDDGSTFDYSLVNLRDWCKNEYEVVNQLNINTANSKHRYDVIILVNGLPLVQIELKRHGVSALKAVEQIVKYKQDKGNGYTNTLMCFLQLFVVSNGGSDTMYFANNNDEHFQFDGTNNFLPVYRAADENNRKVVQLFEFSDMMLQKCTLGRLISRYMVLVETERKVLVMRPYQIYAVERIINKVSDNDGNGYIWHTTGSGKTLTSFKASTLLKDNKDIEKCVFVVDRKDLDKQTREEFNKFQEGCVEKNANTGALVARLESDNYADKVIVTTIQKLANALDTSNKNKYYERLMKLKDKHIVFIFDECHRGQFRENHKAIKNFFHKAQLFGFTGTPIFEENSTLVYVEGQQAQRMTTKDVFGECLHDYTINHAIKDKNVLPFKVEYYCNIAKGDSNSVQLPTKKQVVNHVLDNHRTLTGHMRFNALLATPSIPDAIKYYHLFKEEQERRKQEDENYEPLNITAVFTPPLSKLAEDLPQEEEDNKLNPQGNKRALEEIIDDYNKQYKTYWDVDNFDDYYGDVQQRIKDQKYPNRKLPHAKKLDVVIVVEMLLTGYDSKFLNTLYVAKDLKWHGLIQAFSRTNRILDGTKPYGNIICYTDLREPMEKAMLRFSGFGEERGKEYWLVEPAEKVVDKYKKALTRLETTMNSMGLECKPEEVINIPQGENSTNFVEAFKEVQRLSLKLNQYVDLSEELKSAIEEAMPEDTLQQFRVAYLDMIRRGTGGGNNGGGNDNDDEETDYELSLFSSVIVDFDYFMKLVAKYTGTKKQKVKVTKEQLIEVLAGSVELMNERAYLQAFIEEELQEGSGMSEEEIRQRYKEFKDKMFNQRISAMAAEFGITTAALEAFVNETVKLRRIDMDTLRQLISHIDGWKERKRATEKLLNDLAPLFDLLTNGGTIEGLNAYVK